MEQENRKQQKMTKTLYPKSKPIPKIQQKMMIQRKTLYQKLQPTLKILIQIKIQKNK